MALVILYFVLFFFFFFQAEDGIRDWSVTGVQTCALPISQRSLDQNCDQNDHADERQSLAVQFGDAGVALRLIEASLSNDGPIQFRNREIGRASCRERV